MKRAYYYSRAQRKAGGRASSVSGRSQTQSLDSEGSVIIILLFIIFFFFFKNVVFVVFFENYFTVTNFACS